MNLDLRLALPDDIQHQLVADRPLFTRCINPNHADKKRPNMAVYADHLHCYSCGLHLEVEGSGLPGHRSPLAALLGITNEEAERAAERYTTERLDAYRERAATDARRDPLPTALAKAYFNILFSGPRSNRVEWLLARGLDESTLWEACLGHNGFQFTIPIFAANGSLLTIRFRRDDEYGTRRPKYMGLAGRNGLYLYPENRLAADRRRWVVLTEGELDALLLWQYNLPAVSATNGARQASRLPAMLRELRPDIHTIAIATDQDEPGQVAAEETKVAAEALGFKTVRVQWSEEWKDVSEYAVGDPAGFRQQFKVDAAG